MRDNFIANPMPEQYAVLSIDYRFTPEEMKLVLQGYLPKDMDDRWFIYCEDDKLYCHRSWTGNCLFIAELKSDEDSYKIERLLVNRDPNQYTDTDPEKNIQLFRGMLKWVLFFPLHPLSKSFEDKSY